MNRFLLGLLTACSVFGNNALEAINENNNSILYCFFFEPNNNFDESMINNSITINFDFFSMASLTLFILEFDSNTLIH